MGFKWSSKRVKEVKKETGLSGDEIRQIAQNLGIKNLSQIKDLFITNINGINYFSKLVRNKSNPQRGLF